MKKALELRKTNPVSYLAYMCQVENVIRACRLDVDELEKKVLAEYDYSNGPSKEDVRQWYEDLIRMMREERAVEYPQHLQIVWNVAQLLEDHREKMLADGKDGKFLMMNAEVKNFLVRYRKLHSIPEERPDVMLAVEFIYYYAIQKATKHGEEMNAKTEEDVKYLTEFLCRLQDDYMKEKEEENA